MPLLRRLLFGLAILATGENLSFGQLRIVTYNTATSGQNGAPSTPRAGMDVVLEAIGNETRQGIAKPIDVLLLQETLSTSVTAQAFANMLNGIYGGGSYVRSTLSPFSSGGGRVAMVYNTSTVLLTAQTSFGNASPRDTARYRLRPIGYGPDADFYVYNDHYKAGSSGADQNTRASHAATVRANANALGSANIIYAGDYNIQSSLETMYQNLLGVGSGQAFDPINRPGDWNDSSTFRNVHTQSPYDTSLNDPTLTAGGLDDRFDFQLVSAEMNDREGVAYIGGSYRAFGNNGSHPLNGSINHPSNTAQPANVLDALAAVSDHLPVVVDYQIPAVMQIAGNVSPGRAIIGSTATLPVDVWNDADVVSGNGADELDYSLTGTGGLSGSFSGTDVALGGVKTHELTMNTATLGMKTGTVEAIANSEQAANPNLSFNVNFEIVDHANPSFDGATDVDSQTVQFGIVAPGSSVEMAMAIHNLDAGSPMADLELLSIVGNFNTDTLSIDLQPFADLEAGEAHPFIVSFDTQVSGVFAASYTLELADEDIPGSLMKQLSLVATGSVALPGDANLDGTVDGDDFLAWDANKFTSGTGWESGDFDGDGLTNGIDFLIWNANKFTSLDLLAVPEPSLGAWLVAMLAGVASAVRLTCRQP